MTKLGGVRNNGGGGAGGAAGGRGLGDRNAGTALKDLPHDAQRAFELIDALRAMNELELRARVVEAAGASEPVGKAGLEKIAALYESLAMPLSVAGVARFKLDRGLVGGTAIAGPVARALVRALDGNEVLVRVDRKEEAELRPSEKACLQFLRELAKHCGADELTPVKVALGLGNPRFTEESRTLRNEYVGVSTVKEIAKATTMRSIPLTRAGMKKLVEEVNAEKK